MVGGVAGAAGGSRSAGAATSSHGAGGEAAAGEEPHSRPLAYTLMAEIGQNARFSNVRKLVRYSLLAPMADDAGETREGKPIGRCLSRAGRATL